MIPRVVIDTNIYISAIFWGGKPREVVDLGRDEKILVFTSSDIEREIVEKLRTKFKLGHEEIEYIISDFSTFTKPVEITSRIQAVLQRTVSKCRYTLNGHNLGFFIIETSWPPLSENNLYIKLSMKTLEILGEYRAYLKPIGMGVVLVTTAFFVQGLSFSCHQEVAVIFLFLEFCGCLSP